MPRNFVVSILLGIAVTSQANADCPCIAGVPLSETDISTLLNGNTVCAILNTERWQEWHSGGRVWELGNNPNGEDVGTWVTPLNAGTVVYSYGAGGSGGTYTYSVCRQGTTTFTYDFCGAAFGGRNVTNASVKPGKGGC